MIANGTPPVDANGKVTLHLVRATTDAEEWKHFIYPDMTLEKPMTYDRALLSVFNKEVHTLNNDISDLVISDFITLYSYDDLNESSEVSEYFRNNLTKEFFNQIDYPNVPPHEWRLKVGMECFTVRNLSPHDGLLNKTQVLVLSIN
ncbi:hypothetical protein RvY_03255 [Ramazzottius varieornatus]|uniref:DNA helicase Pif1-like 2B domain-containing protein n=1 Tax=Ramazzottius varieornatus TaxID=947166 RepID=A0A1D1UQU6_RAMVA|nr:hypothetical protein RvY_03255 [Ramazzottius varieornatus]